MNRVHDLRAEFVLRRAGTPAGNGRDKREHHARDGQPRSGVVCVALLHNSANKRLNDFGYHPISGWMGEQGRGVLPAADTSSTSGQAGQAGCTVPTVLCILPMAMVANMLDMVS